MSSALRVLGLCVMAAACGCQEPPPEQRGTTATTTESIPSVPTTSTTTTFPTDTTFGGTNDQQPDHWLHVTETGQWNLPGGDYLALTGTLELLEIVDELDTEQGPDCLVTWNLSAQAPMFPTTCAGCDPATLVYFEVATGDPSTCQSPDLPPQPGQPGWRMAFNPSDNTIYRDINGTGVWVAWWTGVRTGDVIDFTYADSYPIFVDEETM